MRKGLFFRLLRRAFIAFSSILCAYPGALAGESTIVEIENSLKADLESEPGKFEAVRAYVDFLNRHERPDDAIFLLRTLGDRNDGAVNLLKAEVYWCSGETDTAREMIAAISAKEDAEWVAGLRLLIKLDYLEGKIDDCEATCRRILKKDPFDKAARVYMARILTRKGDYGEALRALDAASSVEANDLTLIEARAKVLDALGKSSEARALRRSMIDIINANPPEDLAGLTSCASAMRLISERKASLQCVQAALRHNTADPFVRLEKARLFKETSGLEIATGVSIKILKKYDKCAMAFEELGELMWTFGKNATLIESYCRKALEIDPTLLTARRRLIYYSLIASDWEKSRRLIKENRSINPRDLETEQLALVLEILESGKLDSKSTETPTLEDEKNRVPIIVGEILAARGEHDQSLRWFNQALDQDDENLQALRGAGFGQLRCGDFDSATATLHEVFSKNRYDAGTNNVLAFLDGVRNGEEIEKGQITIGFDKDDSLIAGYALHMAEEYLVREKNRFGLETDSPLRIQLCNSRNDLGVITHGVPKCSCGPTPAGPTGSVYFGSTVFVWTPEAAGGSDTMFRFDESLHRGITHFVLQNTAGSAMPQWIRDGFARYAGGRTSREWTPVELPYLLGLLRMGFMFPLAELEREFWGEYNSLCRVYAMLVVQEWTESYGHERAVAVVSRLRPETDWIAVAEDAFGKQLEAIDAETRAGILARYQGFGIEPRSRISPKVLLQGPLLTDKSRLEAVNLYLEQKRYGDAFRHVEALLEHEEPPTRAFLLAGRIQAKKGDNKQALENIELGLAIEKARRENVAVAADYDAMGSALLALGREQEAAEAFKKAIELNPWELDDAGPFGKLVKLYDNKDPKPQEYYDIIEKGLFGRRTDAKLRQELARYYEKKGDLEKAFGTYKSIAGIRPDWVAIHRRLAEIGMKLNRFKDAHASYQMIHASRPTDKRVFEKLRECEEALAKSVESGAAASVVSNK
ncbi:tetratricopeptide repeat protein [Candidatus Hydrogenedentota bacterium]